MIAYSSADEGRAGVYVRSIDANGRVGEAALVAERVTDRVAWTGRVVDGRPELYVSARGRGFVTTVQAAERPVPGPLTPAHEFGAVRPRVDEAHPLPDGRVLAVQRGENEEEPSHLVLVQNWAEEVRRRIAASPGRE